jgi:hypothetical protein
MSNDRTVLFVCKTATRANISWLVYISDNSVESSGRSVYEMRQFVARMNVSVRIHLSSQVFNELESYKVRRREPVGKY